MFLAIMEPWGEVVPQLGVLGVLVWYMYYTTTKTIPEINKENSEMVEKIVEDHKTSVQNLANTFDQNLKEERLARREEVAFEREARRQELVEEREVRKKEIQELAAAIRSIKEG